MAATLRLHHMGFVVADIATAMPAFVRSMAAEWDGKIFEDPLQKAKVAFLTTRPGDPQIELVQLTGEDSPVARFLKERGGMHHLCYRVADLEAGTKRLPFARCGNRQPSQAGRSFWRTPHRLGDNLGEVPGRIAGREARVELTPAASGFMKGHGFSPAGGRLI